jgi:hypothetical protein
VEKEEGEREREHEGTPGKKERRGRKKEEMNRGGRGGGCQPTWM